MHQRKVILAILLVVIFSFSLWIYHANTTESDMHFVPAKGNTCTVFLIDGLDNVIFKEELSKGNLPVLAALVSNSLYVEEGISSFPTMTGYAFYPFITGHDATESGILGLRWFDRSRDKGNLRNYVGRTNIHMNADIHDSIPTYFELADKQYTASVNTYMNRGVKESVMTGWAHTTAKYEGKGIFRALRAVPWLGKRMAPDHFRHESDVMDIAVQQLRKNPKLHWITFPSPDAYNHVFGTQHTYRELLRYIDHLIGVYIREIRDLGQEGERSVAVISDHGISDVNQNFDFCSWASDSLGLNIERGKSVNLYYSSLKESLQDLMKYDGYFVINGNLSAYLYMKNPAQEGLMQWRYPLPEDMITAYPSRKKSIDLPLEIAKIKGIELVVYRQNKDEIVVRKADQKAIITRRADSLSYNPISGNPLKYPRHQCYKYFTKSAWLENTAEAKYPNAIPRIYTLMMATGVGDILMTSAAGVDLASDYEIIVDNYKGGHGGIRREIISVPYIYYRPGYRQQRKKTMTSEDLGKLIGEYLYPDEKFLWQGQ